ncbi:forkhead box protein P1-like isoform X2 [Haliotis rufescens]|uniref:forkhead box protein P1-like isoform X2 n=1 Tax=Haliotis rufescens TaxID=6454 RepID=UPI00201EBA31|nr:forkhead box protein P1-like isoform X2 [Haliotis rufescens]
MLEMRVELGYRDNNFLKPAHFPTGITPPPLLHASSLELFSPPVLSPPPTKQPRLTAPGGSYLSQGCCREPGLMIPLYHCNQSEASAGMLKNNDSVVTAFASSARRSVSEEHLFFREKCNRTSHSNAWCRSSSSLQEHGMMEEEVHQDAAINLSTGRDTVRDVARDAATVGAAILNGDVRNGDLHQESLQISASPQAPLPGKNSSSLVGAAKRKLKSASDTSPQLANLSQQPLLMMAAQHGLSPQQVQQLLQQQGVSPQQLQQMMQQQQTLMLQHQQQQKLHEQVLHQLNEQLQLNVLQQSQLIQQQQQDKQKSGKHAQQQLQQLAIQQQQLIQQIQQIQLQQRQYLLACLVQPFSGMPQGMMSPAEIQQLWKEVAAQSGLEETPKNGLTIPTIPSVTSAPSVTVPPQTTVIQAPSYMTNGGIPVDGFLLPGIAPLNQAAPISIRHNDSAKAQIGSEAINGSAPPSNPLFRHSVCKWPGCDTPCDDYHAFSKHLNSEHVLDDRSTAQARVQMQVVSQLEIQLSREKEMLQAMMQHLHMKPPQQRQHSPQPPPQPSQPQLLPQEVKPEPITLNTPTIMPKLASIPLSTAPPHPAVTVVTSPVVAMTPTLTPSSQLPNVSQAPATPQSTPTGAGTIRRRVSDKCNLPISAEIQRNRDFYKNTDVRPPFTYASLIRQAIIESPHRQLTLNEIYQWFQNTFAYFRRNEATWKNAVRHNLSLHKCFMRVENVKGAVWTVDEVEFYKRRPQKLSGSLKSPSLSDPSSYNETLNASLRAALGEASMAMLTAAHNQMTGQESAEDLSMKSLSNSQDGCSPPSREEEMMMLIKQEPSAQEEEEAALKRDQTGVEEEASGDFLPTESAPRPEDMEEQMAGEEPSQALVMADIEDDQAAPEDMSMEEQPEALGTSMVVDTEAEGAALANGGASEAEADSDEDLEMLALRRMQQEASKMVAAANTHSTD